MFSEQWCLGGSASLPSSQPPLQRALCSKLFPNFIDMVWQLILPHSTVGKGAACAALGVGPLEAFQQHGRKQHLTHWHACQLHWHYKIKSWI